MIWQLKLGQWPLGSSDPDAGKRMVEFEAETALDAARRYVDAHRGAAVLAIREKPYGVFEYRRGQRIIE